MKLFISVIVSVLACQAFADGVHCKFVFKAPSQGVATQIHQNRFMSDELDARGVAVDSHAGVKVILSDLVTIYRMNGDVDTEIKYRAVDSHTGEIVREKHNLTKDDGGEEIMEFRDGDSVPVRCKYLP